MRQTIIRYAVMLVALCVFGYAAYQLTLIYLDSEQSMDVNDDIANMFMVDTDEVVTHENGEPQTDENGEKITMSNSSTGGKFVWDYDLLLSYSSEAN